MEYLELVRYSVWMAVCKRLWESTVEGIDRVGCPTMIQQLTDTFYRIWKHLYRDLRSSKAYKHTIVLHLTQILNTQGLCDYPMPYVTTP